MPVKRRLDKRREAITDEQVAWLHDEPTRGFLEFESDEILETFWREHSDHVFAEHVAEYPGTRPARWWEYDSPRMPLGAYPGCFYDGKLPEPRKQISGSGVPDYERFNVVPSYSFGLPRLVDADPDNPPVFESEAAYLERHGLLLPGEKKQLTKVDFEAETVI